MSWRRFALGMLWIIFALLAAGMLRNPEVASTIPSVLSFLVHHIGPHLVIGVLAGITLRVLIRLLRGSENTPSGRSLVLFATFLSGLVSLYGLVRGGWLLAAPVTFLLVGFLMVFIPTLGCALTLGVMAVGALMLYLALT